ncbi:hypothetical protein GCM10009677_37270 [Sphaerisporangium rubeum]|uniref:Peptidase C51 domain-containing protein n=1 Tax=Sphaerisporangium rubeum TaxID=321317 RepID=A0A7X0IJM4_9ACTN|nr:CHAP domain-containing protein [Sphaerisporangium rubeum]MBB6475213.1 hypothetical protein [Sphaerisporangium rubeum]
MIKLLKSYVGYSEQAGGYTKFGDWYNSVEFDSDYSTQPWCDMFLSWAAHQLGYDEWFGQFAHTVAHADWFIAQDAFGTTPEQGAVVFFDWSGGDSVDGIDHVGMVIDVDGDTIHTIEGNVDGQYVREKTRDQSIVVGYGYPDKIKARLEAETMAIAPSPAPGVLKAVHATYTPATHTVIGAGPSGVAAAAYTPGAGQAIPGGAALLIGILIALLAVAACLKAHLTR